MTEDADPNDLQIAGLSIRVFGRRYPGATNRHDADWLNAHAHCEADGARVVTGGTILGVSDLRHFHQQLGDLNATLAGTAELSPLEPGLRVRIAPAGSLGRFALEVEITPDHLTQSHTFRFDIDQSYFTPLLGQLRTLLARLDALPPDSR